MCFYPHVAMEQVFSPVNDSISSVSCLFQNDVSDIPDLTFSMDADEEKHILYEKTQVQSILIPRIIVSSRAIMEGFFLFWGMNIVFQVLSGSQTCIYWCCCG